MHYATGAGHQHGRSGGCLKGTCQTVLNDIELWAMNPAKPPIYWLSGLAGTGKSTIARTIAARLFADGRLGATFFCSKDFKDQRNPQLIFPTLAFQLAHKYKRFRSILVPLIQSNPGIACESLYSQMKKLIVQPLKESHISTVIIIDALDECEDVPASVILSIIGQFVAKIPKVKFFLTGYPEPCISAASCFLPTKASDTFTLHEISLDQVHSDIQLFFKASFLELASHWSGLDDWPNKEELDFLCEQAAGLFVHASVIVRFIHNDKWSPRKQLDILLQSQRINSHKGRATDSLYTSILQEAFSDSRLDYDDKIRSILGAVVLAINPLSPSTIATLLGFDPKYVLSSLSSAKSLLIFQEDVNRPIRPFHRSFSDFVTNPTQCTNQRFYISPKDHHLELLVGCLDLMNWTLKRNMCKLPVAVTNLDVNDLKERAEKYIDPALQYACTSWHIHLAHAYTIPAYAPMITPTLRQFLGTKFLFWLEVLSILGAVRNAIDALQVTVDWLGVC